MLKNIFCIFGLVSAFSFPLLSQHSLHPTVIGTKDSIYSKILVENRPFYIHLPESYQTGTRDYPIIFVLDGESNFHHTTATVDFLSNCLHIPEMIVVGIPNTGSRTRDLTPPTSEIKDWPRAGGADNMLAFIRDELIPHIDNSFRTHPYKVLIGHSFGGLFALHTLIHHPGTFNAYIAISPSLWWDEQELVLAQSKGFFQKNPDVSGHLYMTMGNEGGKMLGGALKFTAMLEEQGTQNFLWHFEQMPEESHSSVPLLSTYKGLEFIFEKWCLIKQEQELIHGGLDGLNAYESNLSTYYGFVHQWEERTLLHYAKVLSESGKAGTANSILKKSVALYPTSDKSWFSLGKNQQDMGNAAEAQESLKTALTINPKNLQAVGTLSQLGADISAYLPEVNLSSKDLETYTGKFKINEEVSIIVSSDGYQLWAESVTLEKEALFPLGSHTFFVVSKNSTINFKMGNRQAERLLVETPDGTFNGERVY
ncbi:MAG: alpha/beta hydrolase-fold protein [Bacteroidota bacterium]